MGGQTIRLVWIRYYTRTRDIETVVCDSVTALTDMALRTAVGMRLGMGKGFVPSMEHPGMSAYGGRNAITLEVLTKLLRITAKHDVHLIMTAHEADPEKDKEGVVQYITIMLGGKLVNNVTWRLSEIWYLDQDGRGRQFAVRPWLKHRPMKSRMFTGMGEPEFILQYDSNKPDKGQMTIASFYEKWVSGTRSYRYQRQGETNDNCQDVRDDAAEDMAPGEKGSSGEWMGDCMHSYKSHRAK